jgi:hypothetical protein
VAVANVQAELLLWAELARHADERLEAIASLQET